MIITIKWQLLLSSSRLSKSLIPLWLKWHAAASKMLLVLPPLLPKAEIKNISLTHLPPVIALSYVLITHTQAQAHPHPHTHHTRIGEWSHPLSTLLGDTGVLSSCLTNACSWNSLTACAAQEKLHQGLWYSTCLISSSPFEQIGINLKLSTFISSSAKWG